MYNRYDNRQRASENPETQRMPPLSLQNKERSNALQLMLQMLRSGSKTEACGSKTIRGQLIVFGHSKLGKCVDLCNDATKYETLKGHAHECLQDTF
ncbi:hypothetical protein M378DRAFT_169164 [Amanita muscaria Koide BX008]|uniref:Uncharacterized protein n=1 Tax=Amanita muscaria (strain Koide BX008) TaxID=946122 RepID=A0A0C2WDV6_AMAMK|nr:hypothetical protein M378DRAFT_169164 [Amanita muscaria Koide BX008]